VITWPAWIASLCYITIAAKFLDSVEWAKKVSPYCNIRIFININRCLSCGGIFDDSFTANFLRSMQMKDFLKSVNINMIF